MSELCYGTLTIGPLQKQLPLEEGAGLLRYAYERGVTFFDTAQLYQTYAYLRESLGSLPYVVATKTYAYEDSMAREAVEEARRELNRDYIDIFLLHEQESVHTLAGHAPALHRLCEYKVAGVISAVGVSTHHIACLYAAADMDEIDIIHPIINRRGIGIADGTAAQMQAAIAYAVAKGKGIYGMKVLGGGHLLSDYNAAIAFAKSLNLPSIAIGMSSHSEIDTNISVLSGSTTNANKLASKSLHIEEYCTGCGNCAAHCRQKALALTNGQMNIDMTKCMLCSYCAPHCPMFAIKIY